MVVALFLLSILLGFVTILGLIIPNKILSFTTKPSRSKALLFFGLPSIILFAISMATTPTRLALALEDPKSTSALSLSGKNLNVLPLEVATLINLKELDLSDNQFTEFPDIIKKLPKLTSVNLSGNPIVEIPGWVKEHPALKEINLNETKLFSIPKKFEKFAKSQNGYFCTRKV